MTDSNFGELRSMCAAQDHKGAVRWAFEQIQHGPMAFELSLFYLQDTLKGEEREALIWVANASEFWASWNGEDLWPWPDHMKAWAFGVTMSEIFASIVERRSLCFCEEVILCESIHRPHATRFRVTSHEGGYVCEYEESSTYLYAEVAP